MCSLVTPFIGLTNHFTYNEIYVPALLEQMEVASHAFSGMYVDGDTPLSARALSGYRPFHF